MKGDALTELLAGFGKRAYAKQRRDCAGIGCAQSIFGYALFCPECWSKIPSDLRRLIERHHRPGRRQSALLARWVREAMDELLYLKTHGRYRPVAQSFMWDDTPAAPVDAVGVLFDEGPKK